MCKNNRHQLRLPSDRIDGECRYCRSERQKRCRERQKLGLEVLQQMESYGVRVSDLKPDSGFGIALAYAVVPEDQAREIEKAHPAVIEKFRSRLADA